MKIRVGVFFGGKSVEHEISIITANQAISNINKEKYEIIPIYISKNGKMYTGEKLLDGTIEPQKLNPKKKYLWGKNFLSQSEIKFEYCLGKIHSSYPDFVMKDSYGRIHLFEVKSVNCSNSLHFDSDEYKDKMEELKRCYLQASLLTGYHFYLPVLKDDRWHIFHLSNGNITTLTLNQFQDFVKANS